jgi:DNA-binding GntR family transcriptional regulator
MRRSGREELAGVERRTMTDRIADALRRAIMSGEAAPGTALPSERELGEKFGVSRGTVRRGLDVLVHEGLVTSQGGLGYFVRRYAPLNWYPGTLEHLRRRRDTPEAGADAWAADVIAQGRVPHQDVDVSIITPPDVVAERLHLDPRDMVVVRRRLRYVDDVPYQIADSYYPRDVAEGTPIMTPGDVTIPGGLMTAVGHRQVRFCDEISIRMPWPEEKLRLGLPAGTPVAEHVRTGYNAADRPVRVIVTIAPGDRHKIIYEVGAE